MAESGLGTKVGSLVLWIKYVTWPGMVVSAVMPVLRGRQRQEDRYKRKKKKKMGRQLAFLNSNNPLCSEKSQGEGEGIWAIKKTLKEAPNKGLAFTRGVQSLGNVLWGHHYECAGLHS